MLLIICFLLFVFPPLSFAVDYHVKVERLLIENEPHFCIRVKGFSQDETVLFEAMRTHGDPDQKQLAREVFTSKESGMYLVEGKLRPFMTHPLRGLLRGEVVDYRFTNLDNQEVFETSIAPMPLESKSKDGSFTVWAELISLNPVVYTLHFNTLASQSIDCLAYAPKEKHQKFQFIVDRSLDINYSPPSKASGGYMNYRVTLQGGEHIFLSLPYGKSVVDFK